MRAISIVGFKNSGKTRLACDLCQALAAEGLAVAAAKSTHHSLDRQDADTQRLLESCVAVAGLGPAETSLTWKRQRFLHDLLPLMEADFLVVEGGKTWTFLPRIIVGATEEEVQALQPELALGVWNGPACCGLPALASIQDLARLAQDRAFLLPGLDCSACGRETCLDLARDIVAGMAGSEDCQAVAADLSLEINGQPVAMNPFVRSMFGGAIRGMLGSLKGVAPGRVDIRLEL